MAFDTEPVVILDADWETWGKLVKTWATGDNRVNPGGPVDQFPIPKTVQEMKEQMMVAGMAGFIIPDRIKAVHFVPYNYEVLVLKLAPKKMIEAGEAGVGALPRYPLPGFYADVFGATEVPTTIDKQKLHNQRVGDYTIRACA